MFRLLVFLVLLMPWAVPLYAAPDLLSQGVAEYKDESFEEAAVTLEKAYRKQPDNPEVVFYLGMSYMKMLEFDKARTYLQKAATLQSKDSKLSIYLGEALYNLKDYKAAEKVLNKAIASGIKSSRAHYFLGLTHYRTNEYQQAVASLAEAIRLDERMRVKALYLTGMAQTRMEDFDAAKKSFRTVIDLAPKSHEAMQAKAVMKARPVKRKPLSASIVVSHTIDNNVILTPTDKSVLISRARDTSTAVALNLNYARQVNNDWGYSMGYGYYQNLHSRLSFYDVFTQHVDITPNMRIGKGTAFLQLSADALGVDYRRYMFSFGAMPGYVMNYDKHQRGLLRAGYKRKLFFWPPANAAESQDGHNYSLGYTHSWLSGQELSGLRQLLSRKGSRLDMGYTVEVESTRGSNWDYTGHRYTLSLTEPLENNFWLIVNASHYRQDFLNTHTSFNIDRKDRITSIAPTLEWRLRPYATLRLQGSFTRAKSNVAVFDYRRSTTSISLEGKF